MRAVIEIILPMIEELFGTGIGENICRYYCGAGDERRRINYS